MRITKRKGRFNRYSAGQRKAIQHLTFPFTMAELPTFFEKEFATNWEQKAQQMDSRLAGAVTSDNFTGKRKQYNELSIGSMTEITERKGDTPDGDSTGIKYWIYRRRFEFVKVWDEDDQLNLGAIILPTSDEMKSAVMAENRTRDDVIISAFDATRNIGENGTDTEAFDTAFSIAVNYVASGSPANSGLTMDKLRAIARIMNEAEVPENDRFLAYGARQLDDMLATVQATSRDYSDLMSLKDGKIEYFMGFKWVQTQRLPYNSGTDVRTLFAWQKDGMKHADAGRSVHIDQLPGRRHSTQLRCVARLGAVRAKQTHVVRVYCDQSP